MENRILKALVVFRDETARAQAIHALKDRFNEQIRFLELNSLEDAIEHLEKVKPEYELILFEYRGSSQSIVRTVVEVSHNIPLVFCGLDESAMSGFKGTDVPIFFVPVSDLVHELPRTLRSLELAGKIPLHEESTSEYLTVRAKILPTLGTLDATVYMLMLDGRYVPAFHAGDHVTWEEVKHFVDKRADHEFYFKRGESEALFQARSQSIEAALKDDPLDPEKVERTLTSSYELLKDLVAQVGFTPEAQRVAVLSVMATIRMLGSKPKLMVILAELKNKEGNYLTAHSLQLGKVACALAHKIGWRSQTTYFKLSLAAFLHDITLNDERLARIFDLESAIDLNQVTPNEVREIRHHALKAGNYAKDFSEIPGDVEQILVQHHERPNGSGFPRGLVARYFTPLSALFIIAQDLIEFSLKHEKINFESFFKEKEFEYNVGVFRKIAKAARTDTTLV